MMIMLRVLGRTMLIWFISTASLPAANVLQTGDNATGILGLDVSGTLYDVVFEYVTDHSVPDFRDIFLTPLSDSDGAQAAALAINSALNSATVTVTTVGPSLSQSYLVPYELDPGPACDDLCTFRGSRIFLPGWLSVTGAPIDPETDATFARFTPHTPSAVPVPPAVYLFGSGLMGLASIARRSRAVIKPAA